MHHFKIIATGSSGNAYLLNNELLLDAGISIKKILKASGFSIPKILITHEHQDHAKSVNAMLKYGAEIYMTQGTQIALGVKDINIKIVEENKTYQIGRYQVTPFKSYHDAIEPVNYQIKADGLKALYITDTKDIPYNFIGITHLLLEINHTKETIIKNQMLSTDNPDYYKRAGETHLSDETAIKWLKDQDLTQLQMLYVIHTSANNCDLKLLKAQLDQLQIPYKIGSETICS